MSFDNLPPNIEQGVQSCATALHITHDEAVIKLLETGLNVLQPQIATLLPAIGKQSRHARDIARHAKLESLAKTPSENASAVFGAFADVPGFQESIDAIIAKRAQRYGFSE